MRSMRCVSARKMRRNETSQRPFLLGLKCPQTAASEHDHDDFWRKIKRRFDVLIGPKSILSQQLRSRLFMVLDKKTHRSHFTFFLLCGRFRELIPLNTGNLGGYCRSEIRELLLHEPNLPDMRCV